MDFGTFSMNSNRIYKESKERDYNINYGRIQNKNSNKYSDVKIITGIATVGLLGFYLWKNVIKPAAKVIKTVIDVIDPEPVNVNNPVVYRNNDSRIFDGKIRRLSKSEADSIKNDPNTLTCDYTIVE